MPTDHYGNVIGVGDTVVFVVGIPGREVEGVVYEKVGREGSRLFVRAESGLMDIRHLLELYDCRVVSRKGDATCR